MARPTQKKLAQVLLTTHGKTFAEEVGIHGKLTSPGNLFQLLCASLLASARISRNIAAKASRALFEAGLTTPEKLLKTSWEERVKILNTSGYARYDERTARMLADTAQLLLDKYQGDLGKLRKAAGQDADKEHELLKEFKGIGDVGADIFLREIQGDWGEAFPRVDKQVLKGAARLHLPEDPKRLSSLVPKQEFPRLAAALVNVRSDRDAEAIREAARV